MGPANVPWSLAGLGSKFYEEASEETNATDRNTNPSVTSLQNLQRNTPPHPDARDKSVCCRSNREANKVQVAAGTGGRRSPQEVMLQTDDKAPSCEHKEEATQTRNTNQG